MFHNPPTPLHFARHARRACYFRIFTDAARARPPRRAPARARACNVAQVSGSVIRQDHRRQRAVTDDLATVRVPAGRLMNLCLTLHVLTPFFMARPALARYQLTARLLFRQLFSARATVQAPESTRFLQVRAARKWLD